MPAAGVLGSGPAAARTSCSSWSPASGSAGAAASAACLPDDGCWKGLRRGCGSLLPPLQQQPAKSAAGFSRWAQASPWPHAQPMRPGRAAHLLAPEAGAAACPTPAPAAALLLLAMTVASLLPGLPDAGGCTSCVGATSRLLPAVLPPTGGAPTAAPAAAGSAGDAERPGGPISIDSLLCCSSGCSSSARHAFNVRSAQQQHALHARAAVHVPALLQQRARRCSGISSAGSGRTPPPARTWPWRRPCWAVRAPTPPGPHSRHPGPG